MWVAVYSLVRSALTKVSLADLAFTEGLAHERLRSSWITDSELKAGWDEPRAARATTPPSVS